MTIESRLAMAALVLLVALTAASCRTAHPDCESVVCDGPDASSVGRPTPDANVLPACTYPIALPLKAAAETLAREELETLSPGADLSWSIERSTLVSISNLNIPLPNCTGTANLYDSLWQIAQASPGLFQLARNAWSERSSPCDQLTDFTLAPIYRDSYGSEPLLRDIFTFSVKRVDGQLRLTGASATYLPVADPQVVESMTKCDQIDLVTATTQATSQTYEFEVLSLCMAQGMGVYIPNELDIVALTGGPFWTWELDVSLNRIVLLKQQTGRLIVDERNETPALQSSNASCPSPEDPSRQIIGFELVFDSITFVISHVAGIGCVVC